MNLARPFPQAGGAAVALAVMLALAGLMAANARADSISLKGGEKLIGKVLAEDADKVVFESQTLGRLDIARDQIERLERVTPAPVLGSTNQPPAPLAAGSTLKDLSPVWAATPAGDDEFDWIQLKSGEWLKGKIKSLQEEKLEFDSEELDVQTFDWKDIRTLRSPRLKSVRLEKGKTVDGSVFVTTDEVRIITATDTNAYPRSDLIAITPTGNREVDKWTGKVSAGVSFRAGNTRETDVYAHATLQRHTPDTRLYLDYLANYGKVNDVQTEQNHRFSGQFDYFLSRRLYARLPAIGYYRDPLANLDHRLTIGGGVGYDLIKTPRTEWNITASPSWQRNWFDSVESGSSTANSAALVLDTRFDTKLTQRLDLIFEYSGQLSSRETGNNSHHAITTLEFEIHKRLKLDLSFAWDRITDPKKESGGETPTPDDFSLITSLGVDF